MHRREAAQHSDGHAKPARFKREIKYVVQCSCLFRHRTMLALAPIFISRLTRQPAGFHHLWPSSGDKIDGRISGQIKCTRIDKDAINGYFGRQGRCVIDARPDAEAAV